MLGCNIRAGGLSLALFTTLFLLFIAVFSQALGLGG